VKGAPEIVDPELGLLLFEHKAWRGETSTGLPFFLRAGASGPDAQLRATAGHAIQVLGELERLARAFVVSAPDNHPSPALTLGYFDVARPAPGWRPNRAAPEFLDLQRANFAGAAVVSLAFRIADDLNVLDVAFVNDRPVALDYH
jgi:hypothetical protein